MASDGCADGADRALAEGYGAEADGVGAAQEQIEAVGLGEVGGRVGVAATGRIDAEPKYRGAAERQLANGDKRLSTEPMGAKGGIRDLAVRGWQHGASGDAGRGILFAIAELGENQRPRTFRDGRDAQVQ